MSKPNFLIIDVSVSEILGEKVSCQMDLGQLKTKDQYRIEHKTLLQI